MIKEIFFFWFPFFAPIKKILAPKEKKIVVYDFLKTETVDQKLLLSTSQEKPFLILQADQFEKIIHLLKKKRKKKKSKRAYGYYIAGGVTLIVVYKIVVATKWYLAWMQDLYDQYFLFKWLSDYKTYFFSYNEYFAQNPFSFFEYPDVEKKYQELQASIEERYQKLFEELKKTTEQMTEQKIAAEKKTSAEREAFEAMSQQFLLLQKTVIDTFIEEQNEMEQSFKKHLKVTQELSAERVTDLFEEQQKKIESALDAQSQYLIDAQQRIAQEASTLLQESLLEQCQAIQTLLSTIAVQEKALDQKMSASSEVLLKSYVQIIEAQKKLEAKQQELVKIILPEKIEAASEPLQKEAVEIIQIAEQSKSIDVAYLKGSFAYCVRTLVSLGVPDELIATIEQQNAQAGFYS